MALLNSPLRRRGLLAWAGAALLATALSSAQAQPAATSAPGTPPGAASAQAYPTRPISLLVPFGPGGIADITARAVAEHMARTLGQPVVVENRPSAGSIVASQAVARAAPDGHTLLLMSNGHAVSVGLFRKLPYDPVRDFAPVSLLGSFSLAVFAPAQSRFASLREAVDHARANPGKLNVGTIAAGSTQHLSAKLFEATAGIDVLAVPYKGSPAVLTALRAGEIDLAFEITGPMVPQVQAGVVKALAVTSEQPDPSLPGVPTVGQQGIGRYQVSSWNALAAPIGTPPAVIERLNQAVRAALEAPEVRDKLGRIGVQVKASTPGELQRLLIAEIQRWGGVIRAAKIEPE